MGDLDPRSAVADLLSRYFRAVDSRDLEATLAVLGGVRLSQPDRDLSDPADVRAFYEAAYRDGAASAHQLGSLTVESRDGEVAYWAGYLRFRFEGDAPVLERVGECEGRVRLTDPGLEWLDHRVGRFPLVRGTA
jgi:hypothetical protein